MAQTVTVAQVRTNATLTATAPLGASTIPYNLTGAANLIANFTAGTGVGQVNALAEEKISITSGTPQTINLASLSSASPDSPLVLTTVKLLIVNNLSAIAGQDLTVGDISGSASNEWTAPFGNAGSAIIVKAGTFAIIAMDLLGAGYTVDSTHKNLTVTIAAGTGVQFTVDIAGTQ